MARHPLAPMLPLWSLLPLLLLLLLASHPEPCAAGEDGGGGGDAGGDGTEDQGDIDMPGDGDSCACADSEAWTSPSGMGPCASYAIGMPNEGYCDEDGATEHCPKACDACPECIDPGREMNMTLLLVGIAAMSICFGVPTFKYFVDIARFSAQQYKMWRAAQDSKMKSIGRNNEVRKAKSKFIALGVAGKVKRMGARRKVAPVPADMRTGDEEAECAALSEQIAADRATLQRFIDEGNGDSRPSQVLQGQVEQAAARQAELQGKRPYDKDLVERMFQVQQQREAEEAAAAAAAAAEEAVEGGGGQFLEPEPEPEPLMAPPSAGGGLAPLGGALPTLPPVDAPPGAGGGGGMRIGGMRGGGDGGGGGGAGLSGGSAGDHAVHKSDVEAGGDDTERRDELENRLAHVRSQMSKEP